MTGCSPRRTVSTSGSSGIFTFGCGDLPTTLPPSEQERPGRVRVGDLRGLHFFVQSLERLADLCAQGYADRMVLAHDAACYMDWFTPEVQSMMASHWHFNHISDDVLPELLERGVTQAQIDQMLVANPQRLFETTGAY